jgi:hypothetical protein
MTLKFVTVSEKVLHMPFVVQCICGGGRSKKRNEEVKRKIIVEDG